jgi:hypothetical protein
MEAELNSDLRKLVRSNCWLVDPMVAAAGPENERAIARGGRGRESCLLVLMAQQLPVEGPDRF